MQPQHSVAMVAMGWPRLPALLRAVWYVRALYTLTSPYADGI